MAFFTVWYVAARVKRPSKPAAQHSARVATRQRFVVERIWCMPCRISGSRVDQVKSCRADCRSVPLQRPADPAPVSFESGSMLPAVLVTPECFDSEDGGRSRNVRPPHERGSCGRHSENEAVKALVY